MTPHQLKALQDALAISMFLEMKPACRSEAIRAWEAIGALIDAAQAADDTVDSTPPF